VTLGAGLGAGRGICSIGRCGVEISGVPVTPGISPGVTTSGATSGGSCGGAAPGPRGKSILPGRVRGVRRPALSLAASRWRSSTVLRRGRGRGFGLGKIRGKILMIFPRLAVVGAGKVGAPVSRLPGKSAAAPESDKNGKVGGNEIASVVTGMGGAGTFGGGIGVAVGPPVLGKNLSVAGFRASRPVAAAKPKMH